MDELVLMVGGCCAAHNIQFNRCFEGTSVYKCEGCGKEYIEYEDTGCGG